MYNVMIFLHVVGAVLLGAYLVFPFLAGRAGALSGSAQESYVGLLSAFNRVGQFSLILVFLSGGAMLHNAGVSVPWIVTAIVLLVAIGAVTGMMGARMKKLLAAAKAGGNVSGDAAKIKAYSWITAVAVVAAVLIMTNRGLF